MKLNNSKTEKRVRRHKRIRSQVTGTEARPRLSVFRSNKFIYAQIIDDAKGVTLAAANDMGVKETLTKTARAEMVGKLIADAAKKAKITTVSFDRGGFKYTGRIASLAEKARENGLQF
ncbi:MAG TPA: 50S ribosomal protein L18 [Candidatus Paceibacterota bacterium]